MSEKCDHKLDVLLISGSALFANQIRQMFGRIRNCDIQHKTSIHTALQFIIQNKPNLIITDWRIGTHTASELLQAMRTNSDWKRIPVIVALDEPSEDLFRKAKALGAAQIFTKPFNQNVLSRVLAELFPITKDQERSNDSINYNEIRLKLESIGTLAPLPALAKKIMEILRDPNSSAQDLAEEIKKDQSITVKILKIVNSAYYGFHREIGNVDHAIVVLGFDEVMNIAQAVCLMRAFETESSDVFDREKFWVHSLGTAYVARALSRRTKDVASKDAFVIGLLHDFGKVILNQHFREAFQEMIVTAASQQRPLHQVCREFAGIDHSEIGGMVAEDWNLPVPLVRAIRYHHYPGKVDKNEAEIHLAHMANVFCHQYGIGSSGNTVPDEPDYISLMSLGIEDEKLDEVWDSLEIDPQQMRSILK